MCVGWSLLYGMSFTGCITGKKSEYAVNGCPVVAWTGKRKMGGLRLYTLSFLNMGFIRLHLLCMI